MRLTFPAGRRGRRPTAAAALLSLAAPLAALTAATLPLSPSPAHAAQDAAVAPAQKPAPAPPAQEEKPLAAAQAVWDEEFVYVAFVVEDTNITGTNSRPMSAAQEDDGVSVYFQADGKTPDAPDSATHAMIVSAAGGFTFLSGDPATKTLAPKPTFTIKYGVTLQGTLNRSDDRDGTYTVTLAVPWSALGIDPKTLKPGTEFGFNAVVRSREPAGLSSLSAGVAGEADAAAPSKWTRLVLAAADGTGAKATPGALVAARVPKDARPPVIDGGYRPAEWREVGRVAFLSPDKPRPQIVLGPSRPADFLAEDSVAPALTFSAPLTGMQRLVMARYRIDYQADRRKLTVPSLSVYAEDGAVTLRHQPAAGVGPWFSSDRSSWHRAEMAAMQRAGVDVALVQIGGPEGANASTEEKALLAMVAALRELAAEGTPGPLLAPLIETTRLAPEGDRADLSQPSGRDRVYAAVRRWVRLVPPELRARVTLPPSASPTGALVNAYPVMLGDAAAIDGIADPVWTDTVRDRFAKDFGALTGGTTLLFAGVGKGWTAAGGKVVAALPDGGSGKGEGPLPSFVVQPGSATADGFAPRRDGAAYKEAWEAAIAARPTWYVIDSWSDFSRGTEVTASRQYGLRYVDLTRIYTIQASGLPPRAVRWLAHDAPRRLRPGQVVGTTVTVQNVGAEPLTGDAGVALTYRWLQNGKVVAEGPLRLPLSGGLLPTRTARLPLGLAAVASGPDGRPVPLPPGDYVAEIDLIQTAPDAAATGAGDARPVYFGEAADGASAPLRISVRVTPEVGDYVQIAGTTTPSLLLGGASYGSLVRLRWMGAEALPADAAKLVYQVVSEDGQTTIKTGTVPLPRTLPPGQWVTVPAKIEAAEATVPVPPAFPEARGQEIGGGARAAGGYRVRWLLTRTQTTDAVPGEYDEAVAVYPPDDQASIAAPKPNADATTDASALVPITVTVTNRGSRKWAKDAYAVGYHWYDPDGIETEWRPPVSTAIDRDVEPGQSVKVSVNVRAPRRDGAYILAFDVLRKPDVFLSTLPVTTGGDLGLMPVRVGNGRLVFIDLTRHFDTDAIASEASPKDGDLDGKGVSFPAESFPPDRYGIVAFLGPEADDGKKAAKFSEAAAYPSSFYVRADPTARETAFKYGPDGEGAKNAVASAGQSIEVPKGRYTGLHLAVTATGGGTERPLTLTLRYKDGTTKQVSRPVAEWSRPPVTRDAVALTTRVHRGPDGDKSAPGTVWHVVYSVDVTKELVGVTLGEDKTIKIFAMTLDR